MATPVIPGLAHAVRAPGKNRATSVGVCGVGVERLVMVGGFVRGFARCELDRAPWFDNKPINGSAVREKAGDVLPSRVQTWIARVAPAVSVAAAVVVVGAPVGMRVGMRVVATTVGAEVGTAVGSAVGRAVAPAVDLVVGALVRAVALL